MDASSMLIHVWAIKRHSLYSCRQPQAWLRNGKSCRTEYLSRIPVNRLCAPYWYKLHVAGCSACACITASYSILQRYRTCAISPLLGDSGVSDLSISISNIHLHLHLHLHLHVHCHGYHCTVPPTPNGLSDAAPPCPARRISINPSRCSSYQMRRIGSKSTLTLRPHWIVAVRVCMQLVSGNHHHLHGCVSRLAVHSRTD